ncbi:hypothetical protein Droror1_Dr00002059 [Drosera rotundifolia]
MITARSLASPTFPNALSSDPLNTRWHSLARVFQERRVLFPGVTGAVGFEWFARRLCVGSWLVWGDDFGVDSAVVVQLGFA